MTIHNRRSHRGQALRWCLKVGLIWTIGFIIVARPASAQDSHQTDVSTGNVYAGSMNGWYIQLSAPMTRRWSLVGQLDGSYGPDCSDCEPNYRDLAGLGGVRFTWHPSVRVSPFWQVLAGGLHSRAEDYYADYCCGLGRQYQKGFTVNYLALQPGVGVTVMVTPRFGVRAHADVQFAIPDQSQWEGMSIFPRVAVGGVIRLGSGR